MRHMTKILLSVATVCALGQAQHAARADTNQPGQVPPPQVPPVQNPPQDTPPIPTDTPAGPSSNSPGDPTGTPPSTPDTPDTSAQPTESPGTTSPVPNPPAGPVTPDTTSSTTTTTTTTTTGPASDSGSMDEGYGYGYSTWSEPALRSGIGVSTILGGGVTGFTDKTMRNTTSNIGGLWDLRVTIGSHLPLALDLSYVGSATNINGLPAGNRGTLIGTTAEGALRWNMLPHFAWTPYVFGGVGWQRYDVTQTHVSLTDSGMNDHDNLLEFPLGAGMAYRMAGLVFDVRGTFRATTDQNLVLRTLPTTLTPTSDNFAPMHTWEASAALGYEF